MSDPVIVDISRPFSINGQSCARFTAWLLAAVATRAGVGAVERSEAAAQVARPGGLAMAISRAFVDFARSGVPVGWGVDCAADPGSLATRGRSQGPFWIHPVAARRLRFHAGATRATDAALKAFVGRVDPCTQGVGAAPLDLDAWFQIVGWRQAAEERRYEDRSPVTPDGPQVAFAVHGRDDLAHRWGVFLAAQQIRKQGHTDRARAMLRGALDAPWPSRDPRAQTLRQLCALAHLWCNYQDRLYADVGAGIAAFERGEGIANPRIGSEFYNLRALWRRSLIDKVPGDRQADEARAVIQDLQSALACALEADAFTLIESIASNLGYSLWLIEPHLPPAERGARSRLEAIRWILLAEWLCQRHGLAGGSNWNLVSVCRVARGAGRAPTRSWGAIAAASALSIETIRANAGPYGSLLGSPTHVKRWSHLTTGLVAGARASGLAMPPLQRAATWLEHAWWLAAEGDWKGSLKAITELEAMLQDLVAKDRVFFRQELRALKPGLDGSTRRRP